MWHKAVWTEHPMRLIVGSKAYDLVNFDETIMRSYDIEHSGKRKTKFKPTVLHLNQTSVESYQNTPTAEGCSQHILRPADKAN